MIKMIISQIMDIDEDEKSEEWKGHFYGVSVKMMVIISTYENLQVFFFLFFYSF